MPGLSATGNLSYNGYVFDGTSHVQASIEFIRDDSGRTITAHEITLTVTFVIAGSDGINPSVETQMENIKARLGETGKALIFTGRGFGNDLVVNVGTTITATGIGGFQDVNFGPHPRILSWLPLGDNKAVECVWQVVTRVPPKHLGQGCRSTGISAINYDITYDIDHHGDTTRTFSGYIEIALQRIGADTADRYRNWFSPLPLRGFHRSHTWNLDRTKRRVNFTITDTQIPTPNPYPPRMVEIDGSHSVSWSMGKDAGKWKNTIEMTITPESSLSGAETWQTFLNIANQRLRHAARPGQHRPFLLSIDVKENLFGRPQSFAVSYQLMGSITDFIGNSGLWRQLGTDWRRWVVSLQHAGFHNRGNSRLLDISSNDIEINLCGAPIPIIPNNLQRLVPIPPVPPLKQLPQTVPKEEKTSFLGYNHQVQIHKKINAKAQKVIQDSLDETGPWDIDSGIPRRGGVLHGYREGDAVDDIIQRSGTPSFGLRFAGRARRAGFEMPQPSVSKVGGRNAILRNSMMGQAQTALAFGVPVFDSWWIMDYILDGPPVQVKTPNNWEQLPTFPQLPNAFGNLP
jgi:hypothetical protein